jgi:hypothetical protein
MLPYRNECQVGWPQGVAGGRQADEEFNEFIIVTYLLHIFYYFLLEGYFFGGDFDWRTQFYLIHHPSPSLSLWLKFFESSRLNALGEFLDQEVQQRRERHQALVEAHLTPGFVLTLQVWEKHG